MNRGREHSRGGNAMQRFNNVAFKATKTDEEFIRDTPIVGRSAGKFHRIGDLCVICWTEKDTFAIILSM